VLETKGRLRDLESCKFGCYPMLSHVIPIALNFAVTKKLSRLLFPALRIHVGALVQSGGLVGREIPGVGDVHLAGAPVGQHLLQMYDEPRLCVLPFGSRNIDAHRWTLFSLLRMQREMRKIFRLVPRDIRECQSRSECSKQMLTLPQASDVPS